LKVLPIVVVRQLQLCSLAGNMINFFKKKWKALLVILGLTVSIAFGAELLLPEEPIVNDTFFDFNNIKIATDYTDVNIDEDLIIRTDRSHYGGWNSTEIYFSIENISKNTEITDIQIYFAGEEAVAEISEFVENIPYQILVNDYGEVDYWDEELQATTTGQGVIGTHEETRYKDEFHPLALSPSKVLTQAVPANFHAKKRTNYNIPAGEIKFFKTKIQFEPKSKGEFLIFCEGVSNKGKLK